MSRFVQLISRKRTRSAGVRLLGKAGPALLVLVLVCAMLGGNFTSAAAAGSTYYVDKTNPACSDANAGTSQSLPWCTLTYAYTHAIVAGDTVIVLGGDYSEQVLPASGTIGNPITFKAAPGATVTVRGSGGTSSAFALSGKSYVVIDGFNITETRGPGIYAQTSNHITITNNHVTYAGHNAGAESHQQGIKLKTVTDSIISGNTVDHNSCTGIRLVNASNNNTISNNVVFYNTSTIAFPIVAVSDAAGIQLDDSTGNTVSHNDLHGNEDSGINLYVGTLNTGSSGNTIVGNLSYGNGDHGIDNSGSANNIIIGNTVQGNFTSGINLEVSSTVPPIGSAGATIANNIVSQNGMNPGDRKGGNIYPDNASLPAVMDYNLYYQSSPTAQQINYNGTPYLTLAAFKAAVSGKEVHGLEADPHFAAPAAPAPVSQAAYDISGDYHLLGGSGAIDSADSGVSGWTSSDIEGKPRYDDLGTTNTGAGARLYDDRGAYEFQGGAGVLPTVTTGAVTNVGQTWATGNGNVTYLGSPAPTQHGVAWGTSSNPTISGAHTEDGPVAAIGPFTSAITGLTSGTLYYVRAYATNTTGTAYGDEVSFTALAGTVIITAPGSSSWTVPAGVTSVMVELWGGGGRGGSLSGGFGELARGGGGGGAYSIKTLTVTPGTVYTVVVGAGSTTTASGQDSTFSQGVTTVASAKGGSTASSSGSGGASGGAASSGIGDTKYSGGGGAAGSTGSNYGGGGGSSAGTSAIGNTATNASGAAAPAGGGSGGSGGGTNGTAGSTPGGGGGGAYRSTGTTSYNGGNGANGQVIITYIVRGTTTTAVKCGAGTPSLIYGAGISCVATVTRVSGPSSNLTGTVAWISGGAGNFVTSPCTLSGAGSTASCSVTYTPTALGVSPHLITATYAGDANFAGSVGTQNVTVNPKALTMSGLVVPASKVYDATTAAVVTGLPALQAAEAFGTGTTLDGKPYTGDVVSILGTAVGAYNSKDVATAANVAFSGLSLTGAAAGNYTLTIQAPAAATITQKALTMSGLTVPASKPYDGNTTAVVSGTPVLGAAEAPGAGTTLDGLPYTGDAVGITGTTIGTYNSKNVIDAATVTFSGLSLNLAQAGNYSLTVQAPALATITAKALTVTGITAADKPYDGTTAATLNTASAALNGVIPADSANVTLNKAGALGVFTPDANKGVGKTVQISGLTITGSAIGNYTLTQPTATASIAAKALTVTGITAANKIYDATTTATINTSAALLNGVVSGETVGLDKIAAAGAFVNKNVGTAKVVNISGLALTGAAPVISNYSLTQPTASADITAKALTMSGLMVPASKPYDGTTAAVVSGTPALGAAEAPGAGTTLDGLPYTGDTVSIAGTAIGTYNSKDVADAATVTFSGPHLSGAQQANYSLTMQAPASATITARDLTVSVTADDKPYDGGTTATIHLSTNKLGSDVVTPLYGTAVFDTKDVGTGKTVTVSGITISGADAGNYHLLNTTASDTASITPVPLKLTANDMFKRHGTTLTFAGTEFTIDSLTPLLNGDMVSSVTLTSAGQPANAANAQYAIEIGGAVGTGLGNYAIEYHNGTLTVGDQETPPVITEGASTSVTMSVNGAPAAFLLTLHSTDLEFDVPTWTITRQASHGVASVPAPGTGNAMDIHYVPTSNFLGADSFDVTADDGFGMTDMVTVNVTVSPRSVTLRSAAANDGWVLESGELTGKGGSRNSAATTFSLGDDAGKKQYRGILSFNTTLPAGAKITGITLKIKSASTAAITSSMFTRFGNILVDLKRGNYGLVSLENGDFQAIPTKVTALTVKNVRAAGGWYSGTLGSSANSLVNKIGTTQFRLQFTLDDNNDLVQNIVNFYSGNAPFASRPVLIIRYYVPVP